MRPIPFNNSNQPFPTPFPIGPDPGLVAAYLADQARKQQQVRPEFYTPPSVDRFRIAELEAARLRQDLRSSRLTKDQIKPRLAKLIVRDDVGASWILDYKSGQWMRFDGKQVIRAEPPRTSSTFQPSPPKHAKSSNSFVEVDDESHWGRRLAWFVVFLILLGVAIAIAST